MAKHSKSLIWMVALAVGFLLVTVVDWLTHSANRSLAQLLQAAALGPGRRMQFLYAVLLVALTPAVGRVVFKTRSPAAPRRIVGLWCMYLASAGLLVSALFAQPAQAADAHWTTTYWFHLIGGGVGSFAIPVGLFAFAWRFWKEAKDESLTTWTLVAAIATLGIAVALVVFPPHALAGRTPMLEFAARRAHFFALFMWCLAVSLRSALREEAAPRERPPEQPLAPLPEAARTVVEKPESRKEGFDWETFAAKIEVLTLPLVLIGGVIALLEYSDGHKRDIREVSKGAYDQADTNWTEFLKVCAEHPETDCYDGVPAAGSGSGAGSGTEADRDAADKLGLAREGAVLSLAVDTFESAFRNYNDAEYASDATENYCDEWPTWMVAMRRYARRESFRRVWAVVGREYSIRFQRCMQEILDEQRGLPFTEKESLDRRPPKACRLDVCDAFERAEGSAKRSGQ